MTLNIFYLIFFDNFEKNSLRMRVSLQINENFNEYYAFNDKEDETMEKRLGLKGANFQVQGV